jgi:hypothetical protein
MSGTPHNPDLWHVALQAQNMAKNVTQERMALAFQSVAMVSMVIMSVTAAAHLLREMRRAEAQGRGR